jgi:hypothetical protein
MLWAWATEAMRAAIVAYETRIVAVVVLGPRRDRAWKRAGLDLSDRKAF